MKMGDRLFNFSRAQADREVGRGNVVALHELFGEALAGFKHGRSARGSEDAHSAFLECVDYAKRKRQFGADDGEIGPLSLGEPHHCGDILEVDGNAARYLGNASVAGSTHHFSNPLATLYRPGQRVFAASRTKDQNFHRLQTFLKTAPKSER